jgi:CHAT domain-containing protein/Tfp pilus assembly protein PilF
LPAFALAAGLFACRSDEKGETTMRSSAPPTRIEQGQSVVRPLAAGDIHPYLVRLTAGAYVRVAAEQRGADLVLSLYGPNGELLVKVDSPTGIRETERVSAVAQTTGDFRFEVVGGDGTPAGEYEIQIEERGPATPAHRQRVAGQQVFQEGEELRRQGQEEAAIARYEHALALYREGGDLFGQAEAQYRLGWMQERLERWMDALESSRLAAVLYKDIGNRLGEAKSLNRQGRMLSLSNRLDEARTPLEEALELYRETAEPAGEATVLQNLGNVHQWASRLQEAIEHYDLAQGLWQQLGNRPGEAQILLSLGDLYLQQGKVPEARDYLERALEIDEEVGDREGAAVTLETLGALEHRDGQLTASRQRLERALALNRELHRQRREAQTLNSLGTTLLKAGEVMAAQGRYNEALALFRALGDQQGEATALSNLGRVTAARNDFGVTLTRQQAAAALFDRLADRTGIAFTRFGSAQALVRLDRLEEALGELETCLAAVESLRSASPNLDLRAFYFASKQHYWDLYIDVLMTLEQRHPGRGYAERALEAVERRRARSLLDSLADVRAQVRERADPALLREEGQIQYGIAEAERRHRTALRRGESEAKIGELESDVRDRLAELEQVRARIRQAHPRLAELERPTTLSLAQIRAQLLDSNTLLLVYSLGEERSFLWRVSRKTLQVHVLPGRERIEKAARLGHDVLSHRLQPQSALRQQALDDLDRLVLEPVRDDLPNFRRLVIVADGALQAVPFAALPDPSAEPGPKGRRPLLVEGHEIVYLPSASVMAGLRREPRRRGPLRDPGPLVAVVADPVFSADDSRVQREGTAPTPAASQGGRALRRALRDVALERLERLPASRQEAEAIAALWPGEIASAFGFDARRSLLEDGRWRQAAILHFATHSLLDDRQPELSGLVFTQVEPDGTLRPGEFLRLHQIYDLDVTADLVVLSACQTGVGRELRGEGVQALTRGFMAAGVPAVIVSLWKVEDRATAELMQRFYQQQFEGYRPAEALRRAQVSMINDPQWSDPALWAGFEFLGDYERKPGDDIEAAEYGGSEPSRRAESDLPPPKVKPRPPKPLEP